MSVSSIEVSEIQGRLHPAAERAAMRYASGYPTEARRALEQGIAQFADERRLWLMLLDLHRLDGHWRDYEAVVAGYRGQFAQDPPSERERVEQEARLPEPLRTGGKACWALGGTLDASAVGTLARLREAASHHTVVHLDLSRLSAVEAAGCRLLADTLEQLIASGNGVVLTGDRLLGRLLREAVEVEPTGRPFWELLLTLLRFAQDRAAFERTALEYALAADVPAPAFEPLIMPQPPLSLPGERRNEPRYAMREQFVLSGVMAGADDPQLTALADFAHEHQYINLELSQLERLDFVCAAQLANTLASLTREGKVIRVIRPNQLVAALLELLNLGSHASIVAPSA
jgi:ABC-type transporter Mla MlaB component